MVERVVSRSSASSMASWSSFFILIYPATGLTPNQAKRTIAISTITLNPSITLIYIPLLNTQKWSHQYLKPHER